MRAELFHAEGQMKGQTDMKKLIFASHGFTNARKYLYVSTLLIATSDCERYIHPSNKSKIKVKGKGHLLTGHEGPEGE